jgi:hypothetical protein
MLHPTRIATFLALASGGLLTSDRLIFGEQRHAKQVYDQPRSQNCEMPSQVWITVALRFVSSAAAVGGVD